MKYYLTKESKQNIMLIEKKYGLKQADKENLFLLLNLPT